jgi:alginate O-acetyltransferase complex protein AlgI
MNFEEPYLSRSPSEFWRRWHMTLSRWLRDYLYVPLGGNRRGPARTEINLMLTMALGGLWHGAGLNFLVWGVLHGALLVIYRRISGGERREEARPFGRTDVLRVILLFNVVCVLWVPFRSPTWSATLSYLRGLFSPASYLGPWPILPLALVVLCGALHALERALRLRLPQIHERVAKARWGPVLEGTLLGTLVTLALLASGAGVEFIYFQF